MGGDQRRSTRDLARRFEDAGVAAIIYTDIDRDGAMRWAERRRHRGARRGGTMPVIASGGIASMADLRALKASGAPLAARSPAARSTRGGSTSREAVAYLVAA